MLSTTNIQKIKKLVFILYFPSPLIFFPQRSFMFIQQKKEVYL